MELARFQDLGTLGKCLRLEVHLDLEHRLSLGDQDTPDFDNTLGIAGHQLGAMRQVDGLFDLNQASGVAHLTTDSRLVLTVKRL